MKTALIITTYNRPKYLRRCLESVKNAEIPNDSTIIIVDDASTDPETIKLIRAFTVDDIAIIKFFKTSNKTVSDSIMVGVKRAQDMGYDQFINLDGDAIVKKDFMKKLMLVKSEYPNNIVTGFNCTTKNKNGTDRHPIIDTYHDQDLEMVLHSKQSVGGVNMCFHTNQYNEYMLPALIKGATRMGNWDHLTCINANQKNHSVICLTPSVVDHIGFDSSMGHDEEPDVACDFYEHHLPRVTLLIIDCVNIERAVKAVEISTRHIQFGAVEILSSIDHPMVTKKINPITTIEEYSRFMIKELYNYFNTDFVLVIQHDGYVLNPSRWTSTFYDFDYIGAKWNHHRDNNVGNGGFSLRSRELCIILANSNVVMETHPEDSVIGRVYRVYLESQGMKFASESFADAFSIESYKNPDPRYKGSFGFHGGGINFEGADIMHIPYVEPKPSTLIYSPGPGNRAHDRHKKRG